jgi:predicted nucleotidyltransferase
MRITGVNAVRAGLVFAMNAARIENAIRTALAPHAGTRLAILFGSLAAGQGRQDSDVDLAIDMGKPLGFEEKMVLIGELAECTGRPIDLIDLQVVGEPLLGQILRHGKRLAGEDSAYAELIKRHVFAEADFMPYLRRILGARRNAWIAK